MKYRIKIQHNAELFDNGIIRIGGVQYGIANEITCDNYELVWEIIKKLKFFISFEELLEKFSGVVSKQFIEELFSFLKNNGHLESSNDIFELDDRDSRSLSYLSWVGQSDSSARLTLDKIQRSRICIIGLGGIGSHVAVSLASLGINNMTIVDPDIIELSNLNRQVFFSKQDIGQYKVLKDKLSSMGLNIINCRKQKVYSSKDIENIIENHDFFVLGADDPLEIDNWTNEAAYNLKIPFGYARYAGPMSVCGIIDPLSKVGCLAYISDKDAENEIVAKDRLYNARPNAVIGSSAALSANMLANEIVHYLAFGGCWLNGEIFHLNLLDYSHNYFLESKPRNQCEYCDKKKS